MNAEFKKKKCVPCEKAGKPLSKEEIGLLLARIKGWQIMEEDGVTKIIKNLEFTDFKRVMGFVNEVADIAEFEGHHPDLLIHDWNKLSIIIWTHSAKGLSKNDFIMAEMIDQAILDSAD